MSNVNSKHDNKHIGPSSGVIEWSTIKGTKHKIIFIRHRSGNPLWRNHLGICVSAKNNIAFLLHSAFLSRHHHSCGTGRLGLVPLGLAPWQTPEKAENGNLLRCIARGA